MEMHRLNSLKADTDGPIAFVEQPSAAVVSQRQFRYLRSGGVLDDASDDRWVDTVERYRWMRSPIQHKLILSVGMHPGHPVDRVVRLLGGRGHWSMAWSSVVFGSKPPPNRFARPGW